MSITGTSGSATTDSTTSFGSSSRARFVELVGLLAISLPLLFGALGLSFLDPDEGLYADIAQQMLRGGDLVLPRFNGFPYLEKPPLFFWLGALGLGVAGPAEWAVRIWSALAALGTVLLTWRMGGRLYGGRAALFAGLALATTVGYALYVRKASTDFVFVFCLTLTIYGFLRDADRRERTWHRFLLAYLAIALGLLTKGLIGAIFPALIIGVSMLLVRRVSFGELNFWRGLTVLGLVAAPWHVAVAWREPELFWFYLVDNQVLRYLNARVFLEDDVPVSTLGFLLMTFIWAFPWSVFVLARAARAETPAAAWRPLIIVWALVVVLFFALSGSKLEYYALPAFPPLALLAGAGWAAGRDVGRWLVIGLGGCLVVGAGAVWIGAHLTPGQALWGLAELNVYYRIVREQGQGFLFESSRELGRLVQALGVVLVAGWGVATLCWARGWRLASFGGLLALGGAIAFLVVRLLYLVEPHHSARAVSQAISARAVASDVVAHEGSLEYSAALPFYTGRRIVVVSGTRGDLDFSSRLPEARGYFVDEAGLAGLWAGSRRVFLVTQRPRDHSVVGTLPPASVRLVGRFGSRWLYSNEGT